MWNSKPQQRSPEGRSGSRYYDTAVQAGSVPPAQYAASSTYSLQWWVPTHSLILRRCGVARAVAGGAVGRVMI